jgi:hypothetical protein
MHRIDRKIVEQLQEMLVSLDEVDGMPVRGNTEEIFAADQDEFHLPVLDWH